MWATVGLIPQAPSTALLGTSLPCPSRMLEPINSALSNLLLETHPNSLEKKNNPKGKLEALVKLCEELVRTGTPPCPLAQFCCRNRGLDSEICAETIQV